VHVKANDTRSLGFVASCFVALAVFWLRWSSVHSGNWVDLEVYIRGAQDILARVALYEPQPGALPFTYPPFAAVVFTPLHLLSSSSARLLFTLGSLVSYLVVVIACGRSLCLSWRLVAMFALAGMALEPVVKTLLLGQVNIYLMAAVIVDCLVLRSSRRGWLVGIAAGIKLVPGVFVLYFLLKRDWPALLRAATGFLATVALGAIVAPSDSLSYWRGGFLQLTHFGPEAVVDGGNQSLTGLLVRVGNNPAPLKALTAAMFATGLVLGVAAARQQLRTGDDVGAVTALAIGALLASPLSWTHHWVWVVPVLMVLVARRQWFVAWLFGFVFTAGFMGWVRLSPSQETLSVQQQAACATYIAAGVFLLTWFALVGRVTPSPSTERVMPAFVDGSEMFVDGSSILISAPRTPID
jgi:alpha-1,2-mannosyltransferase